MKWRYSIDRTQKEVLSAEVDLATARFNVPRHLWRRIIINALVFVPLLVLARHLEQPFMFWFALAWGGGITLWQILFYGFFGNTASEEELKATRNLQQGHADIPGCLLDVADRWRHDRLVSEGPVTELNGLPLRGTPLTMGARIRARRSSWTEE